MEDNSIQQHKQPGDNKMTFDEKVFKVAQRIIENPWFMGAFYGFVIAYFIYKGI